jgi:hypothetical protein
VKVRAAGRRFALAAAVVALAAVAAVGIAALVGGSESGPRLLGGDGALDPGEVRDFDPLAYDQDQEEDFLRRGRDGYAHVLYEKSPGGVGASAARTARWRGQVEAAAERAGVDGDTLEALVFLESGGRPDVIAGEDARNAAGLAQILPGTALDLLGMSVDLERSRRLTRRIARDSRRAVEARTRARRRAAARRAVAASAERRRVDARFDPPRALAGAARYLALAEDRFGREDLAAVSYHMGIGNLEDIVAAYVAPRPAQASTRETVDEYDLSWPRIFFDTSPVRNPRTYRRLLRLGDDSRTYLFRLEAAREIMRLWREDRDELRRLNELQTAKGSSEEVLRPRDENPPYEDAGDLRSAYEDGELARLPNNPRGLGFRLDPRMGELAPRLEQSPSLYRGLRPDALATLLFIAKEVRRAVPGRTLEVTSTVRDVPYQERLLGENPEATAGFSLHTTGYALDIRRRRATENALVAVLDRLQALGVIAWVYEPQAIHLTVGPEGERYMPLYETLARR